MFIGCLVEFFAMTTTRYCYHCGASHPEESMRLFITKTGRRWRCIRTIQATRKTEAERDAFGKMISAINEEIAAATKRRRVSYEL